MKNLSNKTLILITVLSALFFSCTKNKSTNAPTPKGLLYLHLHTNIDTNEVTAGTAVYDSDGRHFQLDVAEFYISGITLHKADGSIVTLSNVYILKTIDSEQFYVDSVVAGNYVSISFNVGIDATSNLNNPGNYPLTNPLSAKDPVMWFGATTQGYIFMNLQGKADTTAAQTGIVNYPFSYQTGTGNMLETVNMPNKAFAVIGNQVSFVHIIADYGKALRGVNFKTNNMATPWINNSVATQIANNIPTMFRYE